MPSHILEILKHVVVGLECLKYYKPIELFIYQNIIKLLNQWDQWLQGRIQQFVKREQNFFLLREREGFNTRWGRNPP